MEKTSRKFKTAVIIAVIAVVVSFVAARIVLYNSPDTSFERGYSFHSWGMSRHADQWSGKWGMRSMNERIQSLGENNLAVLILFCIGNLGMLSLVILGLLRLDKLIKRINAVCEGDGKKTAGIAKFLLLGIITFGIYNLLWLYMLGDRLQENAQRYNLSFKESGAVVLLWFVPGMFILVGPVISLYIILKNTNALSSAYIKGTT